MTRAPAYRLVRLANDAHSIRYERYGETLHPVAGPMAEAEALYVRQLRLRERIEAAADVFPAAPGQAGGHHDPEFVIWDVGLGAAANALTAVRCLDDLRARVRLESFDETLAPLRFAFEHREALGYFGGFEPAITALLEHERHEFTAGELHVRWTVHAGDFPTLLARAAPGDLPAPHAILFDPFSPAKNPAMWTLGFFRSLFALLEPHRPCGLATYSRATFVRTAMLLAGFFVGRGGPVAGKEETTRAANDAALIERPLDRAWLERARRSHSAEPLRGPVHRQERLSEETLRELQKHPQFC